MSKGRDAIHPSLLAKIEESDQADTIRKEDVKVGDRIVIKTKHSTYLLISTNGEDEFLITGGYFDERGVSPAAVSVHGCTFGGSMLKFGVVAVVGMHLECSYIDPDCEFFGKAMSTSSIHSIYTFGPEEA